MEHHSEVTRLENLVRANTASLVECFEHYRQASDRLRALDSQWQGAGKPRTQAFKLLKDAGDAHAQHPSGSAQYTTSPDSRRQASRRLGDEALHLGTLEKRRGAERQKSQECLTELRKVYTDNPTHAKERLAGAGLK